MSELRPMLEDDATEAERWLLRSVRIDVPPASGKRRALAALGLAAAATTTASTSGVAAAATASAGWVIKCIAVGTVGGVIVAGAVEAVTAVVAESPHLTSPRVTAPAVAVSGASMPHAPAALPVAPPPADPLVRAEDAHVVDQEPPVPSASQTTRSAIPATAHAEPSLAARSEQESRPIGATLAQEVRALDEARRALASGDVESALQILDAYDIRVAKPRLGPEAIVLRIEALLAEGQFDRARELGERLLAKDPEGAYAQHVRSLLRQP
jgi:hypothetical protein